MPNVPDYFGCMVFNETVMRERLPSATYKSLKNTIAKGLPLDVEIANVVANAMKDWAIEKGVTHYTHWFQPMTGITAEKHDSFISPIDSGRVIMEFSGKELIKGESDASSFPSGGLRATFEARGYTAWDPTSYAFIKDGVLCIPTVFYSYSGEVLDKKTPLLRSMEEINRQALRILKLFGKDTENIHVSATVGAEQEYFLVDREMYLKRRDLVFCGRTLFGAKPPKGQEMDDHYFGAIRPRVSAYMKELDEELWKMGILAKTKHNEAAPAQHELAPIFTNANIASDHNQLTMEIMKKVAEKHGLICLLHEKPFQGVNGSGKHNNWSLATSNGKNLLDPGSSPSENAQFLLFLCAFIKAVDKHQDLLRLSIATAGNDHRLGANEAPPAIVSVFLGEELNEILDAIKNNKTYTKRTKPELEIGVDVLPHFPKDTTDRNRTAPLAFTGNKFEFRMLGSSASVADSTTILNTIVADALSTYATELEDAVAAGEDFTKALNALVKRTIKDHSRIIFNGNGYGEEWQEEAKRRGLLNLPSTPDALPYFKREENIALFEKYHIFCRSEVLSRTEILLENYTNTLNIEALTLCEIAKKDVLPAIFSYMNDLAELACKKRSLSDQLITNPEMDLLHKLTFLTQKITEGTAAVESALTAAKRVADPQEKATAFRDKVFASMQVLRSVIDEAECLVGAKYWPFPTYGDLLFTV